MRAMLLLALAASTTACSAGSPATTAEPDAGAFDDGGDGREASVPDGAAGVMLVGAKTVDA